MGRRRQDHYTRRAQAEGYPARSVYKLQEIQKKYNLFSRGMRILDLGAAPGSWSMYLVKLVGPEGHVTAVDLQELGVTGGATDRFTFYRADFTGDETAERLTADGPFTAVVSDAAPATTGNRTVDTLRSAGLVESILYRLPQWLAPGGTVVCKLFQGSEEQALLAEVRSRFEKGHMYKPAAVRKESFEVYLVGTGFRGT